MVRPLRIAMMIESDGPGGAEMMVFRLSQALTDRGHTVVPVHRANGNGWLGDRLRGAGFDPESFTIRWPIDFEGVRGLSRVFRKHDIDVVHSHEFTMAIYGAAAARRCQLPHVMTMHGGFKVCKVLRRRVALRWAMRNSAATVMVSKATQRQFATDLGLPESFFSVVPNGVPPQNGNARFVREEFGIERNDCVLLSVGTLETHKGHRVLLEALARLVSSGFSAPWKLIIAGGRGGDQHQSLLEYSQTTGLADRVRIVTNRDDVPDLLALSDVFVIPSLWEGLPMALLEAMIAGKTIVASATAGIPEAIVHGDEGLLVPPGNVDALSKALAAVISDPARRAALSDAAYKRGIAEFSADVMAARYEQHYERSVEARSRALLSA